MGKTPEKLRLVIWVAPAYMTNERVMQLMEQGHSVVPMTQHSLAQEDRVPHVILHPAAHQWDDTMWPLLDVTMKAARKRKKGQESEPS